MANQYVNKVEYGNDTLIDLTGDSVTPQTLLPNTTAHNRSGAPIIGSASASVLPAVDTDNILGGGAGASTNTQAMLDGLADGYGAIRTDLSDYHVTPSRNLFNDDSFTYGENRTVTVRKNDNKKLVVNGTPDSGSFAKIYVISASDNQYLGAGSYVFSIGTETSNSHLALFLRKIVNGSESAIVGVNGSSQSASFTLTEKTQIAAYILIDYGYSATNDVVTPIIYTAADYAADSTYEPYFIPMRDGKLDIADEQVLGAWNLLSVPANVVTQTNNGVTFTITRDSSGQVTEVDANGTAGTGGSRFTFTSDNIIRKGRYYAKNGTGFSINYQENGVVNHSGNTDDFVVDWSQDIACRIVWDIAANTQVNHVKFYPQLALKPNMPYVPYAMNNRELTTDFFTALFSHPVTLTSSDNLNDVKTAGIYSINTSVPTNAPTATGFTNSYSALFVLKTGSGLTQIYIQGGWRTDSKHIAIRGYGGNPSTWSSWRFITDATS